MSIEIVLIPLAIAAVSAWQAKRADTTTAPNGVLVCEVSTRMKDAHLLQRALQDTGAIVQVDGSDLTATWADVAARFTRDQQGVWSAHITGSVDEQRAIGIVTAIDQAYGRQVQSAVVARIRAHASESGLTLKSESVAENRTVTMVLEINQASA
jgi:hypothetical protein